MLQRKLERVEPRLSKLTSSNGTASSGKRRGRRRGFKVSARTRKLMSLAAKKRYAKNKPEAAEPKPARRKWRMSAEGRKRIGDAARRRWAAVRATKEVPKAEVND